MRIGILAKSYFQSAMVELIRTTGHTPVALDVSEFLAMDVSIVLGHLSPGDDGCSLVAWAKQARRDGGFPGQIVFVSFSRNAAVGNRWSITGAGVPGTTFLRLPAGAAQFVQEALKAVPALDETQLGLVVRNHCCTDRDLITLLHDLENCAANCVDRLSEGTEGANDFCATVARSLGALGRTLTALKETALADSCDCLAQQFEGPTVLPANVVSDEIRALKSSVEKAVWGNPEEMTWSPAGPADEVAPSHFDSLLVVDDDGYPNACQSFLRERQYQVSVVESPPEALAYLAADPHAVVISDLNFRRDLQEGIRLFRELRSSAKAPLLIALSSAQLPPDVLQLVDGFCAGPLAKSLDGARRLHAIVSVLARTKGAKRR